MAEARDCTESTRTATAFCSVGETFATQHWPGAWCVEHGEADRFGDLLDMSALRDIEALLHAHRGMVKVLQEGGEVLQESRQSPEDALVRYRAGCTVCVVHVHKTLPEIAEWTASLARELGVPVAAAQCNAYASPSGTGTRKHFDNHEVIVVHVTGSKQWQLAENRDVPYPPLNYVAGSQPAADLVRCGLAGAVSVAMPEDAVEVTLQRGSALFVPRGMWHATSATEPSLSLSFGFTTPTLLDVVLAETRARLLLDPEFRRPVYGGGAGRTLGEQLAGMFTGQPSANRGGPLRQEVAEGDPRRN